MGRPDEGIEQERVEAAPEAPDSAVPPPRSREPQIAFRLLAEWVVTLLFSALIVLGLRAEVASPYRIPSSSMEPALHCARPVSGCEAGRSDRVVVNKLAYRYRSPHRGEIVVFHAPLEAQIVCGEGGVYVKRLIGLPGEVVSERQGQVYIDGRHLVEPYIQSRDDETKSWPRLLPGHYFMMGDNRPDSCDSRLWGPVARSALVGPVFATYWPLNRLSWR
jgi:signal peptidase I